MIEKHPLQPVFNSDSKILILGSFPSALSRKNHFYYGNPQNRFWKLLSFLYDSPLPESIGEKTAFLLQHKIALSDVIASCDIKGSSDSSITNVIPNDISQILNLCNIEAIFLNGKTANKLFDKFLSGQSEIPSFCLPSTSPANASYNLEKLIESWKIIKKYTD